MTDKEHEVLVDKFTICTDADGEIKGMIKIGPHEDLRFTLSDGRSWPASEVEIVHDGMGNFQRAVLTATGEVLFSMGTGK